MLHNCLCNHLVRTTNFSYKGPSIIYEASASFLSPPPSHQKQEEILLVRPLGLCVFQTPSVTENRFSLVTTIHISNLEVVNATRFQFGSYKTQQGKKNQTTSNHFG